MASFTQLEIINLARQRIGAKRLENITDDTAEVNAAVLSWEYVVNEVLEADDWRFAKTRRTLSKAPPRVDLNCNDGKHLYVIADKWLSGTEDISIEITTNSSDALSVAVDSSDSQNIQIKLASTTAAKNTATLIQVALRALTTVNSVSVASWTVSANATYTDGPPTNGVDLDEVAMISCPAEDFDYAYLLPSDFLKIATRTRIDRPVDPTGAYASIFDGQIRIRHTKYVYVMEALPDGTLVLLTDYDNDDYPLQLIYIREETDVTKWTAHFASTIAFRLAADLSLFHTEAKGKLDSMMSLYDWALSRAKDLNQSSDYVEDEADGNEWERAGRW